MSIFISIHFVLFNITNINTNEEKVIKINMNHLIFCMNLQGKYNLKILIKREH